MARTNPWEKVRWIDEGEYVGTLEVDDEYLYRILHPLSFITEAIHSDSVYIDGLPCSIHAPSTAQYGEFNYMKPESTYMKPYAPIDGWLCRQKKGDLPRQSGGVREEPFSHNDLPMLPPPPEG